MPRPLIALALVIVLAASGLPGGLSGTPAWAQPSGLSQAERYFRLEWETGKTRRGDRALIGYVHNDHGLTANNVRLLVESLDASGQVIGRTTAYVYGTITAKSRAYFEARPASEGATYRLSVQSFEFLQGGGAG